MSHQTLTHSNGIIAIDPGPKKTGVLAISKFENVGGVIFPRVDGNYHYENYDVLTLLDRMMNMNGLDVVIEAPEPRGLSVGKDVFNTLIWAGRFTQYFHGRGCNVYHMYPRNIKITLCGVAKASNAEVRQAILDILDQHRYHGTFGRSKKGGANGPLFGITDHSFACMRMVIAYLLLKAEPIEEEKKKYEKQ